MADNFKTLQSYFFSRQDTGFPPRNRYLLFYRIDAVEIRKQQPTA